MREARRKQLCDLLDIIEEDLLIELLHTWRDKKSTEFWNAVDQPKILRRTQRKSVQEIGTTERFS